MHALGSTPHTRGYLRPKPVAGPISLVLPPFLMLLFVPFLLLLLPVSVDATVTADRHDLWNRQRLHGIGNELLEKGMIVASYLDGMELSVKINRGASCKKLFYLIGKNQQFGFTITPCTGPLHAIHFHSINTVKDEWVRDGTVFTKWTARTRRSSEIVPGLGRRSWYRPPLRVELLTLDGNPQLQAISKGPNWLRGSGTARLHFTSWGATGDTLVVTVYGQPGTTFRVLWSANISQRYQPHQGYPCLPQPYKSSQIDVCHLGVDSNKLRIRWPPAVNEDSSTKYCVAVNDRISLIHQCSIDAIFNDEQMRRQCNFVYDCTQANHIVLRLPTQLSPYLQEGKSKGLFVNVYTVNTATNLSTAFPPLIPREIPRCVDQRSFTRVWVKLRPVTYVLHWLKDVVFDWPSKYTEVTMFLQPCLRQHKRAHLLYNMEVFHQEAPGQDQDDRPVFTTRIPDRPIVHLPELSQTFDALGGTFRLRLSLLNNSTGRHFVQGEKVARLFFLNATESDPLPQRATTTNMGVQADDGKLQTWDHDKYPVRFDALCATHQVSMTLPISQVPHSYWIKTLSLPEEKMLQQENRTIEGIEERINHCEYSTISLASFLGPETRIHTQSHTSTAGQSSLEVKLPLYYETGHPRFHLVLVYAARTTDVTAAYRSLLVHRVVDVCRTVEQICYASQFNGVCS
ncbi:unnamed protein product [Mesocestoides corti]|uniref:Fibronectin type-III domain-containing protein n=1 Tax=Mesocestoides corti TaxID=53468 RepID=A0A158QVW7_MESCO|nr:unnamed protein product [Mesocestoides corti]